MSGWAFSISSNRTTENSRQRTLLGELAALLVAHVTGRRAEQQDTVCFSMYSDMSSWISESSSPNRNSASVLDSSVLPTPGRPREDERATGRFRVLQVSPGPPDGLRQRPDRVVLTDHALVQLVFHAQQALRLFLGELEDRDAGRSGEDLGDELLVDLSDHVHVAKPSILLPGGLLAEQLLLGVPQRSCLLEVLGVDRRLLLASHLGDLLVVLAQVGRRRHAADAHPRSGLVDQVDRLVRQEPVADLGGPQAAPTRRARRR